MKWPARKSDFLLISAAIFVLDQWSKFQIESSVPLHRTIEVIPGFFNLIHVENTGVAFGLFAARGDKLGTWLLTGLGLVALAVVSVYFARLDRRERLALGGLALVLGGAVGNLVDRVLSGGVTDFLDFYHGSYHWHTFNVADSAITLGVCVILLDSLLQGRRTGHEPATAEAPVRTGGE